MVSRCLPSGLSRVLSHRKLGPCQRPKVCLVRNLAYRTDFELMDYSL